MNLEELKSKAITAMDWNYLNASTINGLDASTINGLDAGTINGLDASTINGLNASTINCLNARTINCLNASTINCLNASTINGLDARTINGLDARTINCLNASTINGLNARTINCLNASTINGLNARTINCLDAKKPIISLIFYSDLLSGIKNKTKNHLQSTFGDDDPSKNTCGTNMCTAGQLCFAAGNIGTELAKQLGYADAARIIHLKNYPDCPPQNYGSIGQEKAMAYIEYMAAWEKENRPEAFQAQ